LTYLSSSAGQLASAVCTPNFIQIDQRMAELWRHIDF